MAQFTFEAIGTHWQIDIYQQISEALETELLSVIKKRIDDFDTVYSRFRPDSLVTKMSQEAGKYELPVDAAPMIELYHDLYQKTDGKVTPLIGNVISDAGYDADYSLKQKKELQTPLGWDEALEWQAPILTIKQPVILDFGAAGKGYLVDLVSKVIEEKGITEYCVDAGGDMFYKNSTPIKIGLEDPDDTTKAIGICNLADGSLCGSAGNRRKWGRFTHTIDPVTLMSPTDVSAVWVTAETTMLADAVATCLSFVSAPGLLETYNFEYVILRPDRSIERSGRFPGEFFTAS